MMNGLRQLKYIFAITNFLRSRLAKIQVRETYWFQFQKSWDIYDIIDYRLAFVHHRYGEKLLESDECPLPIIKNITATGIFGKPNGKKETKKMNSDILEFFQAKDSIFYKKKVIFRPEDYKLKFRMNEDELKLRPYQADFDFRAENILLDKVSEHVNYAGLRTLIL